MEAIETTGKNLAAALAAAAEQLGVSADFVAHEVVEESAGLFGKSSVRIRAWVADAATAAETATEPETPKAKAVRKTAKPKAPKAVAAPTEVPAPVAEAEAAPEADDDGGSPVLATPADADAVLEIVRAVLAASKLTASASVSSINDRYVNISLEGRDVAFLIGKRGEALNSLQYLLNIILGKRLSNGVRLTLDGNDYRNQRETKLTNLALQIAREVKRRGEEAVLDALPAFERRIVHKALMDFEGITTYSEGEEPNRRVVIAPAD
jgi:spoIIIJ-associated protein